MKLPESDEEYLRGKGYDWSLFPDGKGGLLIMKGFPVNDKKYDQTVVDLMIRIPAQYNVACLDMWYVDPPLHLVGSGAFPEAATAFETHGNRSWQRFSRHLPPKSWRAGVD